MKNSIMKKLFTTTAVATVLLPLLQAPSVLADNNTATAQATGETNAKVAINKVLDIAEGITVPNATFTFTFTPKEGKSSNGANYEKASETESTKGHIPNRSVTYSSKDSVTANKVIKATEDIFKDVSYDHAGEYVYTVKEVA
ncbi:Spy0128 family protein, partial [Streptococcus sp. DD10]|uniref:Spy0128 family protein n=1 Tax=Streptococcus sp. DD10 TaxID=1777878 RepID=UPI002F908A65